MRPYATLASFAAVAVLGAALAACASNGDGQTEASGMRQCFNTEMVNNFRAGDDQKVYLRAGVGKVYELKTYGNCLDIDWAMSLGIEKANGFGSVCPGDDVNLYVRNSAIGPQNCRARMVGQLSEEQLAALPERQKP